MQEAELKNKSDKELEKLKTEHEQEFSDRKKSPDIGLQKQKDNNEKRPTRIVCFRKLQRILSAD